VSLDASVSLSEDFAGAFGGVGIEFKALGFRASRASGCPIRHFPNCHYTDWPHAWTQEKRLFNEACREACRAGEPKLEMFSSKQPLMRYGRTQ
jgi:hypothetical protein